MYQIHITSGEKQWDIYPVKQADDFCWHIPKASACSDQTITLQLCFMDAKAGTPGYYVFNSHLSTFLTYFRPRENATYSTTQSILPFVGCKLGSTGYLLILEGMPYGFGITGTVQDNTYRVAISYNQAYRDLYEDIRLRLIILHGEDANYSGMARAYRKYVQAHKKLLPLANRIKTEPTIAYGATDMPVIRIRMGWKPVPTPVQEQTIDTEPPMHVACTFQDVELLMDEMKHQGIEKAELSLVGWNIRGHDGRWPQMLPVEEALGGETGLRNLISHAKTLGYRISCHTNHSDAYRIADTWDERDIIHKKDGSLSVNADCWSGGRMYHLCPQVAFEKYVKRYLPILKELGFSGFHYIDVLSLLPPRTCCNPLHPLNAAQSGQYINRILSLARETLGGVSSEGGNDFCIENLDFALYMAYNIVSGKAKLADEMIPLWQIVYNGYVLSNPSAETVNYFLKSPDTRLRFYEFGGIPVVYFYSRFVNEGERTNWMGKEDMHCATETERKESARIIKSMLNEYHPFARRRLAFMDDHSKLADGVYETVYSDGWHTVVNYSNSEYTYGTHVVPAKDLIQFHGEN